MGFTFSRKILTSALFLIAAAFGASAFASAPTAATPPASRAGGLGVIKGVVRDQAGSAIADATVAIFRAGTSKLLKQVRSASDGSFIARIIPGTYTVLAVAEGFNPVTIDSVDVGRSAELVYGFKLVRAGSGNTLPEKLLDRNSSKWRVRAANSQRSIYQNVEGPIPVDDDDVNVTADSSVAVAEQKEPSSRRNGATAIETYFANTGKGNYSGMNFATLLPVNRRTEVVLAGQVSTAPSGPGRIEALVKFKPSSDHTIRTNVSIGKLGSVINGEQERTLGQISFQALDEWTVREGVIVVFGLDYSRFIGAGDDSTISPRLGLQFDLDPKTRFRAAYTTQTEQRTWADAIELEDTQIAFQEPVAVDDLVTSNGRLKLNKSRRFELGIERVLDNSSSIEATAFFDLTLGRGVGLASLPIDSLDGTGFSEFVANQQGRSQGLRVVYNRRLSSILSAAAGYSFGSGQRLSKAGVTDPSSIFENGFFQSAYGQLTADFGTGTNVRTIFRLSPQATVFAIDPFQGRLAIYDPSLSVLVTQNLPTLGLPFHAEAIVDARNLFGFSNGISTDDGVLKINSQQRVLRGGILVRF